MRRRERRSDENPRRSWARRADRPPPFTRPRSLTRPDVVLYSASGEPLGTGSAHKRATSVTSVDENGGSSETDWPDPIPLGPPPPPELPLDGLPPWLSNHIASVTEHTQAPRDMAVLLSLTAISTAVANKGRVIVKTGYSEPLQVWTVSVVPPGGRKSPVFSHMMRPIKRYESEEAAKYRLQILKVEDRRDTIKTALKTVKNEASDLLAKGNVDGWNDELCRVEDLRERLINTQIPVPDVITVSDITSERLGQLMGEHFGRAAVVSPEGDIFNIMAGLYTDGQINVQSFKKAWTGDEPISDDRITRKGTRVERPALVVGVTIQPVVLETLRGKNQFRGEGVLGRFMFVQPNNPIGFRRTGSAVPALDDGARQIFEAKLRVLLNAEPQDVVRGEWVPHDLPLSNEAAGLRDDLAEEVERDLRPGGKMDGMKDWGAKIVGNSVRLSGLIHLAWQVEEKKENIWDEPISGRAMETAVRFGRCLVDHARRVLDEMDLDPNVRLARYVWDRIISYEEEEPLTEREVLRRCGSNETDTMDDLEPPLDLLEAHNLIRRVSRRSTGGRPPSPLVKVNPNAPGAIDRSDKSPREHRSLASRRRIATDPDA